MLRALLALAALAMRRGFFGASPRSSVTAAEPLSEAEAAAQEAALDAPKNRRRLPKKARARRAARSSVCRQRASTKCVSLRQLSAACSAHARTLPELTHLSPAHLLRAADTRV